jgi:hypothetical protein
MFTLTSDFLHDVRVDVQGPHLVFPDRCVLSRSARCGWVAVARGQRGWPFMAGRTRPARLPQRPRLTSRPVTCQLGLPHGRAPSPGRHRGPAGRREEPHARGARGTLGRWIRIRFTVCHLLGRSLRGRADGSLLVFGTGSSGTVRARARDRRHPKVPTWVESSAADHRYPQVPPWLTGLPCGRSLGRHGEDCCDPLQDLDIFAEPAVLLAQLRQHPPGLCALPHRVVVVCRGAAGW